MLPMILSNNYYNIIISIIIMFNKKKINYLNIRF